VKKLFIFILCVFSSSVTFSETWHSLGIASGFTHENYGKYNFTQNMYSLGIIGQDAYWYNKNWGVIFNASLMIPIGFTSNISNSADLPDGSIVLAMDSLFSAMLGYKYDIVAGTIFYTGIGPAVGFYMEVDKAHYYNGFGYGTAAIMATALNFGIESDFGLMHSISKKWAYIYGCHITAMLYRNESIKIKYSEDDEENIKLGNIGYTSFGINPYIALTRYIQ